MSKGFYEAVKARRSYYDIAPTSKVADSRLEAVIAEALKHTPSPFNAQSGRILLLLGEHHQKLWQITLEALRKIVPADKFASTQARIQGFASGYGTVLFFDDEAVIADLQKRFALYKDNFPVWANQSNGMLQFVVWNALEIEGLGASLQHYNPLIDDEVQAQWQVPQSWKLIAQMPFGDPQEQPEEKDFLPLEPRFKVFA